MYLWGQIISIFAMAAIVLSFQCKSNRMLTVVTCVGALLFAFSYLLLGQYSTTLYNIVTVIGSLMCLMRNLNKKLYFGIIVLLYILASVLAYDGFWTIVLMSAQIATMYSIMFKSGTFIRNMRLFYVTPIWIINNTLVCFSVGGLICETITLVSIIVSFIRYRKTGFDA